MKTYQNLGSINFPMLATTSVTSAMAAPGGALSAEATAQYRATAAPDDGGISAAGIASGIGAILGPLVQAGVGIYGAHVQAEMAERQLELQAQRQAAAVSAYPTGPVYLPPPKKSPVLIIVLVLGGVMLLGGMMMMSGRGGSVPPPLSAVGPEIQAQPSIRKVRRVRKKRRQRKPK